MPINGAGLLNSGEIRMSGSIASNGSSATESMISTAFGGAPHANSNISSGNKTNISLTTLNVTIGGFTNNGSCDGTAPHGMDECRGAYQQADDGPGGGR
mgnify:CR=1 FL=1